MIGGNCGHEQLTAMRESAPVNSPARRPAMPTMLLHSPAMNEKPDFTNRLFFLQNVVADAQGTIRFLDTKAAFCVTLLTAMVAAAFHVSEPHRRFPQVHLFLLGLFAVCALICLATCVRVIFPTIHIQGRFSGTAATEPSFFLVPIQKRHRLRDTLGNTPPEELKMAHASYTASVMAASDADLARSLCDEVVTISFLRQVKSDRLHVAIQVLTLTVLAFFVQLAI